MMRCDYSLFLMNKRFFFSRICTFLIITREKIPSGDDWFSFKFFRSHFYSFSRKKHQLFIVGRWSKVIEMYNEKRKHWITLPKNVCSHLDETHHHHHQHFCNALIKLNIILTTWYYWFSQELAVRFELCFFKSFYFFLMFIKKNLTLIDWSILTSKKKWETISGVFFL
jgi:hypothetical protein